LLSPLLKLHGHAIELSTRLVSGKCSTEPERAFRGEARGALTWLHCILTEERDFCRAEGCPACVVLHILSSEPTIRLIAVACMFSQFLPQRETDANINSEVRPETKTKRPPFHPTYRPLTSHSGSENWKERFVLIHCGARTSGRRSSIEPLDWKMASNNYLHTAPNSATTPSQEFRMPH